MIHSGTVNEPSKVRRWLRFRVRTLFLLMMVLAALLAVKAARLDVRRRADAFAMRGMPYYEAGGPRQPAWREWLLGLDPYYQATAFAGYGPFKDSDWRYLASLDQLQVLRIANVDLNEAAFECIVGMPHLEELTLTRCRLRSSNIADLSQLQQLRKLDLSGTNVDDNDLAFVRTSTKIEVLNLFLTDLDDAGLVHLRQLTNLRSLHLGNTHLSDTGLAELTGLRKLEVLGLGNTAVTSAGMVHLQQLTELRELYIYATKVDDATIETLKPLTKLEVLWLGTNVTDAGLTSLDHYPRLKSVWLVGSKVSGNGCRLLNERNRNVRVYH
jgi:Leucine-rich repeat (LRR) protein